MPLYHDSGLGGGAPYRSLPLPGPVLVIDVRSSDNLRLLQYLATELEDLTREMRLNQVSQWRYLAEFIKFLKIEPLEQERLQDPAAVFIVGTPTRVHNQSGDFCIKTPAGQGKEKYTKDELTQYLGEEYLIPVRNNRIKASNDYSVQSSWLDLENASPEQSSVRVFFLIDLKDDTSFTWAMTYSNWLREWCDSDNGPIRFGRNGPMEIVAVCMNAAPHRDYPVLAQPESLKAFDTVILTQTYRDDNGYIDEEAQTQQAELILYTLLLHWPESMERVIEDEVTNPIEGIHTLPRPTYTIGISAFENSAHWGIRWLDYGLAAEIIKILCDSTGGVKEEKQLQFEAETFLNRWWQRLQELIPDKVSTILPSFQVFDELERLAIVPDFRGSSPDALLPGLQSFCQQVSQLYMGTSGATLQRAYASASLIPTQLKQAYLQAVEDEGDLSSPVIEVYEQMAQLQEEAQQFLLALFHNARGALPRALRQLATLTKSISAIQQIKQNPPNLEEYHKEFEQKAREAQQYMERQLEVQRLPLLGKKALQREMKSIREELSTTIVAHVATVRRAVAATVALTLLQGADLYSSTGELCPYQKRLQQLNEVLSGAQKEAVRLQMMADERLNFSVSEKQMSSSRTSTWRNLNNRKDLLRWDTITESYLQSYKDLPDSKLLKHLAKMLLRHLGSHTSQLNGHNHSHKTQYTTSEKEAEQFQEVSTELVAALLDLKVEDTNFVSILPLLNQYAQMKQRILSPPSVLDSKVLDMRQAVKEAMLEQAIHGHTSNSSVKNSNLPVEFVLAGWIGSQHAANPQLKQALDSKNLLTFISDNKNNPSQLLKELGKRNRLDGFPDEIAGDDHYYLLLPPSDASQAFLEKLEYTQAAQVSPIPFPDTEKLIYLHIHRIRQIQTFSSSETQ